jgi:hypothetical protein
MSFLEELAAKRQKLLDGIEANEGDINLRIFEDFYPDEAHFIYELLQNAEDADATEVLFELTPEACFFEHNGKRHFNEGDIKAITGIFNSSKKDNPEKIGKFGVGFKSVFVYTNTPIVYSKNYSFQILHLVKPEAVAPKTQLGDRTRFEFPFNNAKKNAQQAYVEIKAGLEHLSETTLLFLNNLQFIRWKIGNQSGEVLREEHSDVHIEVLRQINGDEISSSHYLRFMKPAGGLEKQNVAVAFELAFTGEVKSFDKTASIFSQLKIVSAASGGKVAVFFPAEKETSGLRFHLHAPFIPELSRASIKNSRENYPLFEQLAKLAAYALHDIKKLGLLTSDFLAVLPNDKDELPDRYQCIRSVIIKEMKEQPLTPTYARGFAPATKLFQAPALMKRLLSDEDLSFLLERTDSPTWAIGANQKGSAQDRFLESLDIQTWGECGLANFLSERACAETYGDETDLNAVHKWLDTNSDEWHQSLYEILYKYCEEADEYIELEDAQIVRLEGGGYAVGREAYFSTDTVDPNDPFPRVAQQVLTSGTKKTQEGARRFLEKIGVRVPEEADEIKHILKTRYGFEGDPPSDEVYIADLERFISFAEKNPYARQMFHEAYLFEGEQSDGTAWHRADGIYLDAPYFDTGLEMYYSMLSKEHENKKWPLMDWYETCGLDLKKIGWFAEFAGCKKTFDGLHIEARCQGNPKWGYLRTVSGERWTSPINRDTAMEPQAVQLLSTKNISFASLVWQSMRSISPVRFRAIYQKNGSHGCHEAPSQLICTLRDTPWVPIRGGDFVQPKQASSANLLEGFTYDASYKWLEEVEFGTEAQKQKIESTVRAESRKSIGFKTEEALQRALVFAELPEDEQVRFLEKISHQKAAIELPENEVRNSEIRAQRITEQAIQTPEKSSELRTRAVPNGYSDAKAEAKIYLKNQYTNSGGQMICQACKDELPFKLPSGGYYFEAVEVVHGSTKRLREAFLALCPNHAAAYQYANAQRDEMQELITVTSGREVELELGGKETTLYFTDAHLADIRACWSADDSSEEDAE